MLPRWMATAAQAISQYAIVRHPLRLLVLIALLGLLLEGLVRLLERVLLPWRREFVS